MSADLLTRLASAGTPMDLVMEVAEALAEARVAERALEKRRENERNRKAKSREVTGSHVTERDITGQVSPDKETPQTPKEINPIPCVRGTRARAKHPLPANWQPAALKPDGQAGMIVARKPVGWIERQLSKFKDHALQNNRQCSDWDAAWRNWIKEADEIDGRRTNGLGRNQSGDGLSPTTRAARAVFGVGASH